MPAKRRSAASQETRTAIVTAAHQLFVERGYHATSMRQIAARAKVALGGIYNHFDSKEAIYVAVLEAYNPYSLVLPSLRAASGATAEAYLRDVADKMVGLLRERPVTLHLMFIEMVEFDARHIPHLAQTILPQLAEVLARLREFGPQLRPVPLPAMVRAFFGLLVSYMFTEIVFRAIGGNDDLDWLGHTIDIFLNGVIARPTEARS
jgi:AcrR family transcriptional regulator